MSRLGRLYDVVAVMGGERYPLHVPRPWPLCLYELHKARARDFARALGILFRTGYECYPIVFKLAEVGSYDAVCFPADAAL